MRVCFCAHPCTAVSILLQDFGTHEESHEEDSMDDCSSAAGAHDGMEHTGNTPSHTRAPNDGEGGPSSKTDKSLLDVSALCLTQL